MPRTRGLRIGGRRLPYTASEKVRPTMGMVRLAIFNIVGPKIADARFLDLFAGTGSVGIEALRLGARSATFVEERTECCRIIRRNLELLGLESKAVVVRASVLRYLTSARDREQEFDVIFLDPPYDRGLVEKTVRKLCDSSGSLLAPGGLILVQHSRREPVKKDSLPAAEMLSEVKEYIYGDTRLTLIRQAGNLCRRPTDD
ncbi:MAG TPA: 16S rRNA (guanine(966)-N(2))-methyltransferase RsmD [Clostridia bacterium]|nr:16S rRNA (guanine(966)-N(2))-methyltransferase RsmD [Clostridia bacterium]